MDPYSLGTSSAASGGTVGELLYGLWQWFLFFFQWACLIAWCVIAWLWYQRNKSKQLKSDNIIDRWSVLIEGGQGRSPKVYSAVKEIIAALEPPRVVMQEMPVSAGGAFSERRDMLVIKNERIKGYLTYFSVRDYGKQLHISWYSTLEPSGWARFCVMAVSVHWAVTLFFLPFIILGKIIGRFSKTVSPDDLNVFDLEELTAYITTVHEASKEAAEETMKELNQDFTKVDTRTRGFLNLS